jgi:hypothetical protein
VATIRFPASDPQGNLGHADLAVNLQPAGATQVIADLGPMPGDPSVAPVSMGPVGYGNGGFVASANQSPYGSDNGDTVVVAADSVPALAGVWPGRNVVRVIYHKAPGATPDVNRSFEDNGPLSVNLGERVRVNLEMFCEVPDPARHGDQRKLTYFKSGYVTLPDGSKPMASTFVLNSESTRFRITIQNPLHGLTGPAGQAGGVRDRRINFGGPGSFKINQRMNVMCELHMNTKSFDELRAEAVAGTGWSRGDGRMIVVADGVTILDVADCCIMSDYGSTRQKPLNKLELGKQFQPSGMTTEEMRAFGPYTENRYFAVAKIEKW